MKRAALAALVLLGLTGCTAPSSETGYSQAQEIEVVTVQTSRGPIECAVFNNGHVGGLSCDWSDR